MSVQVTITKTYPPFQLDVDFSAKGKRIGILGASGSGKSLILKCLAGIEKPDRGRILVNEKLMYDGAKGVCLRPQNRRIGYLFQNYALFPTMSVEENIGVGLKGKREERKRKTQELIRRFQLEGLELRLPSQLSGGQQQRVALARILAHEPEVILLDEPFSALDLCLREEMQKQLEDLLADYEGTVILVSHNREEVYRMCEELLILDQGRLAAQGKTREVFANPGTCAAARLIGCRNISKITRLHEKSRGNCAAAWGRELQMTKPIADGISSIGIQAHDFTLRPPEGEPYIRFPVYKPFLSEEVLLHTISFQPSADGKVRLEAQFPKGVWDPDRDGIPGELYLSERKLLFLKEEGK